MSEAENEAVPENARQPGDDTPLPALPTPEQIIADLEAQVVELKDQALRAVAEAENVRRRSAREKLEAGKYSIASLARDLLAVPDTLARAIAGAASEDTTPDGGLKNLLEGIELTQRQLLNIFERHGIKPIDPLGEKFDPNFHQAVFDVPDSGAPDGTVIQILQTGYVIGERLLRPAMVGVAKSTQAGAGETAGHSIDTSA